MTEFDSFHSVYSLIKGKPKKFLLFLFIFLFLIMFGYFLFLKIESITTLNGIYHCEKSCVIDVTIPYQIASQIKTDTFYYIDSEKRKFDGTFSKVEYSSGLEPFQTVTFKVNKLSYTNYQTIEIKLILKEETYLEMLWKALKGGE